MRVGLISDTHELFDLGLRPLFSECDLILHAGDVTRQSVLTSLGELAPVWAVRGNNDMGPFGESLPRTATVPLGELSAFVVHELGHPERPVPAVRRTLAQAGCQLVLFGHSHRPLAQLHQGVLFVNPGSAGPRRFSLPCTAGLLNVDGRRVRLQLHALDDGLRPFGPPLEASL
jgi:putative phosphoesterase